MTSPTKLFINLNINSCITYMIYRLYTNTCRNKFPEDSSWFSDLYLKSYDPDVDPSISYENYSLYEDYSFLRTPLGFYVVSDYFAKKLILENALVTNYFGFWIWGREASASLPLDQDNFIKKIVLEDPIYEEHALF